MSQLSVEHQNQEQLQDRVVLKVEEEAGCRSKREEKYFGKMEQTMARNARMEH